MLSLEQAVLRRILSPEGDIWQQPCIWCEEFFPVINRRNYCSIECRQKMERFKRQDKTRLSKSKKCVQCGTIFSGVRIDKKYCSERCGNRARGSKWEKLNPEKVKTNRNKTREMSWRSYALSRIKHKSRRLGIPFNLCPSDLDAPDKCSVLGIELNYCNRGSGYHADSPSIDRIVPKFGYVRGNIRVISARANLLKNDATIAELEAILNDLKKLKQEGKWS